MQLRNQYEASRIYSRDPNLHGSSRWSDHAYLKLKNKAGGGRIFLGYGMAENQRGRAYPITTDTQKHLLTIAPTRSGKLVTSSAPRCLDHEGPLFALDLKDGELAAITAKYRRDYLGHKVILIDPWDVVASKLGMTSARFNPLDWLDPTSDDFVESAFILSDSIVADQSAKDAHWDDEARALISGLNMYVKATPPALYPTDKKSCDLAQVRRLLNLSHIAFREFLEGVYEEDGSGQPALVKPGMIHSANDHVRAAASRILNKEKKEFSGVLSTAQRNTHWLESPIIQKNLSASDFAYSDLGDGKTDIYIILPASRIFAFSRFLRLHTGIGLMAVMRLSNLPDLPVYFLIEEAATLGRMPILETAFALMAGYGMQIHLILQDLSQLVYLYGERWQTFIANSGVIQFFGTRDFLTSEYASKLCGITTIENLSEYSARVRASLFTDPRFLSRDDVLVSRPLITPDEVMIMHPATQLILLPHTYPIACFKSAYFLDQRYRDKNGTPLYAIHPKYEGKPVPRPVDFTRAGFDIGAALGPVFDGGGD